MSICRFLVINGVVSQSSEVPPISTFLESHPGAYTTTRTHNKASSILFWERHLSRLVESTRILAESRPEYIFGSKKSRVSVFPILDSLSLESKIVPVLDDSLRNVLPIALKERNEEEELMITALISGKPDCIDKCEEEEEEDRGGEMNFRVLDVYLHIGFYVPPLFGIKENGAHLALVGPGRDPAKAKFSDWVRLRKGLENLRPPSVNELLLSNDGDHILEGCVTNFFVVVRRKANADDRNKGFEVQTASLEDGVLPGIIRQVVIDVCLARRIPFREVAPSWSEHELWEEAFITSGLRLVQHVETIRVPSSCGQLRHKTWKEVLWREKHFKEGPGDITAAIQREIMQRASFEGYPLHNYL